MEMIAVKDWLIENDPNIGKLHEELNRKADLSVAYPSNLITRIKLKVFQGGDKYGSWKLTWYEDRTMRETSGQRTWLPKANTSKVKRLWDEIQTDFSLDRATLMAYRDMALEDSNINLLWQIIWIEPKVYSTTDLLIRTKPIEALIIYNNKILWNAKAQTKGKTLEFNFIGEGLEL